MSYHFDLRLLGTLSDGCGGGSIHVLTHTHTCSWSTRFRMSGNCLSAARMLCQALGTSQCPCLLSPAVAKEAATQSKAESTDSLEGHSTSQDHRSGSGLELIYSLCLCALAHPSELFPFFLKALPSPSPRPDLRLTGLCSCRSHQAGQARRMCERTSFQRALRQAALPESHGEVQ